MSAELPEVEIIQQGNDIVYRLTKNIEAHLRAAVFAYSEWLDSEGLVKSEYETGDMRSHEQLVEDFIASLTTQSASETQEGDQE